MNAEIMLKRKGIRNKELRNGRYETEKKSNKDGYEDYT